MVHIEQIRLTVITGNINGASTNGHIFCGIGGREFRLNKSGNQFQRGDTDTFQIGGVIGPDSINNPNNSNDLPPLPGTVNAPAIEYNTLDDYPTYIRFEPQDNDDNWNVSRVELRVTDDTNIVHKFNALDGNGSIWLGENSGLFLGLK